VDPVRVHLGRQQRWLYEALLDAVDHEQDRLQDLAPMAAYRARQLGRERMGAAVDMRGVREA
jgi:hypothetical protein